MAGPQHRLDTDKISGRRAKKGWVLTWSGNFWRPKPVVHVGPEAPTDHQMLWYDTDEAAS